jgi:hypothetical protein
VHIEFGFTKQPLKRPRIRWENNIKINVKKTGSEADRNGSGSCPMVGCTISKAEP